MTAGLFATLAMTHVGPLVESPVNCQGRLGSQRPGQALDEAGAELLVQGGQASFEIRPQSGHLRGELLEQLQGLAGRHVTGEEGIRG